MFRGVEDYMIKKKGKKGKKSTLEILRNDFEAFDKHWKQVIAKEKLADDEEFLHKLAEDIKELDYDALELSDVEQANLLTSRLILHLITTPWGAPFVSDKSLLDAALTYDYQNPMQSDLHSIVHTISQHGDQFNQEVVSIFNSLTEVLEKEEKE